MLLYPPSPFFISLQAAARAVKEQTDRMVNLIRNRDPIFSHLPSQTGLDASTPVQVPVVSSQPEVDRLPLFWVH